jgi:ATP-binding cassette, subfamily B, bacterial
MFKKFPTVLQYDEMDCGANCLKIICAYYNKHVSINFLRNITQTSKQGTTLLSLQKASAQLQFNANGIKLLLEDIDETMLPCIAYINKRHFAVIYKITATKIYVSDPALGLLTYTKTDFKKHWQFEDDFGILLTLKPNNMFEPSNATTVQTEKTFMQRFRHYLTAHKRKLLIVATLTIVLGILQIAFPIITQQLVDNAITTKKIHLVYTLLLAQLLFFMGRSLAEVYSTITIVKLGFSINFKLVSAFLQKLFKLPLQYFDVKMSGDILQRINDLSRIEYFLTHGTLGILMAVISLGIFGAILCWYSFSIFSIFLIGSLFYWLWVKYFMKRRAILDYKNFSILAARQEKSMELIYGMSEIKLNNASTKMQQNWEAVQREAFNINLQSVKLSQWQYKGASIISELKNIVIIFYTAYLVMQGSITLGVMLAISYIIGQLSSPLAEILIFMQQYQDAQLSASRIGEIEDMDNEDAAIKTPITSIPAQASITLNNVSYAYNSSTNAFNILNNLNITIPYGKTTAVVGHSGSGKTTLLKMLLKFYLPSAGEMQLGNTHFNDIQSSQWLQQCGVVMQDAYIFSDTIENNIALQAQHINDDRMQEVLGICQLTDLVNAYPLGVKTKIGNNGVPLSGGEKQRIIMARALYRNPNYIFLDEATCNLDAISEAEIVQRLKTYLQHKTVFVIAHRLSTIKQADQIIVMHKGQIVETGTHENLLLRNGHYAALVAQQL